MEQLHACFCVDKSFPKDLSHTDYSTSQKIFLKFEKNSIKMLDFSLFFSSAALQFSYKHDIIPKISAMGDIP